MSDRDDPRDPADREGDSAPTEAFDTGADSAGDPGAPTERFDVARDAAADGPDAATRRMPQQSQPHYPDDPGATSRMPAPGDDAPTERFGASPPWQPSPRDIPVYDAAPAPVRRAVRPTTRTTSSGGGRIALIVIGVLLVVALIVLALVFFDPENASTGPSASPTASEVPSPPPSETPTATPTPTPTPTPEPEPEPEPAEPATFVSFTPGNDTEIACPDEETEVPLTFSWTSSDATAAWIAAGETDARANPDAEVEPSGTYTDLVFDCAGDSEIYTVSLENEAGELTSQSVTLRRALEP